MTLTVRPSTPRGLFSCLLTGAVHLVATLFRFAHKVAGKVLRNGSLPISHLVSKAIFDDHNLPTKYLTFLMSGILFSVIEFQSCKYISLHHHPQFGTEFVVHYT